MTLAPLATIQSQSIPSREQKHLISPEDSFRFTIIKMKFGRGIVGAATVAVASAATHGVHHPNQRQFHERTGYG